VCCRSVGWMADVRHRYLCRNESSSTEATRVAARAWVPYQPAPASLEAAVGDAANPLCYSAFEAG
jgi:hypothetical protein